MLFVKYAIQPYNYKVFMQYMIICHVFISISYHEMSPKVYSHQWNRSERLIMLLKSDLLHLCGSHFCDNARKLNLFTLRDFD